MNAARGGAASGISSKSLSCCQIQHLLRVIFCRQDEAKDLARCVRNNRRDQSIFINPFQTDPGMKLLVLNGPNLNLLGAREPHLYGHTTWAEIEAELMSYAQQRGAALTCFQSNHEGALIDRIHAARHEGVNFILINAGALTHTSVALRDALTGVAIPFVEVHLSNVHRREAFRHHSYLSDVAEAVLCGFGPSGYRLALEWACDHSQRSVPPLALCTP